MSGKQSTRFEKLVVDDKILKVFRAYNGNELPKDISDKLHLKGIEVLPATDEEFMDYYVAKYGAPVLA